MNKPEFKTKLTDRLNQRLETQSFNELTCYGSRQRFDMELAITGYPFQLPPGANEADYSALLTEEQYLSGDFDSTIEEVYLSALP